MPVLRKQSSPGKTVAVLIPAILAQAAGNVLLSKCMKAAASGSSWEILFSRAMGAPEIWAGTALLIISFILFAAALSWADLTFVLPAISAEVAVNVYFAKYFLEEAVSGMRWAGVLLICFGVILVWRSERKKACRGQETWTEGIR